MNILPHKSWHVRTKKNIARVRKDEREAAEKEQERLRRSNLADQEAKINLLRQRTKAKRPETEVSGISEQVKKAEHVNFFSDLEDGKYVSAKVNEEHVKEKKEEQEKYEKQIGYLTFLAQDTNEATGKRDWYDVLPNRLDKIDESGKIIEVNLKTKLRHDPLAVIERFVGKSLKSVPSKDVPSQASPSHNIPKTPKHLKKYEPIVSESLRKHRKRSRSSSEKPSKHHKKSKKHKEKKVKKSKSRLRSPSSSATSSDEETRILQKQKLEKLRTERLQREKVERERTEKLLAKLRGDPDPVSTPRPPPDLKPVKQKYNSQFNPEIARQNYD